MSFEGPEYWTVIYKAVGDFGDLMRKAAEARAELDALKKSSMEETSAETTGNNQAATARNTNVNSIQRETTALGQLGQAAKQANVQTAYGGRDSMQQHLSDLQTETNLTTLLNRQHWLGFSSPQQAFSFMQQQYQQKLLSNRADFAGYQTADQYLGYLQRQIASYSSLAAAIRTRQTAIQAETAAMLSNTNAAKGTHSTISQLGEAGSTVTSNLNAYSDALNNLPDSVETDAVFDTTAALADLRKYRAELASTPAVERTVLTSGQTRGAQPLLSPESRTAYQHVVSQMPEHLDTTARFDIAQAVSKAAELRAAYAAVPRVVSTAGVTGGSGVLGSFTEDITPTMDTSSIDEEFQELAANMAQLRGDAERDPITPRVNIEPAEAQLHKLGQTEHVVVDETTTPVAAGGSAGGLPPPVTPPPATGGGGEGDDEEFRKLQEAMLAADAAEKKLAQDIAGADFGPNPNDARQWEQLELAVEGFGDTLRESAGKDSEQFRQLTLDVEHFAGTVGDGLGPNPNDVRAFDELAGEITATTQAASVSVAALRDLAVSADTAAEASRYAYAANTLQAASQRAVGTEAEGMVARYAALAAGSNDAGRAAQFANAAQQLLASNLFSTRNEAAELGDALLAAGKAARDSGADASSSGGRWGFLTKQLTLFGGFFGDRTLIGEVAVWHVLLDGLVEIFALWVPAIVTAGVALGAWGVTAAKSFKDVAAQLVNVYTTSRALDTTVAPLTDHFQKMQAAVRPQVYELFGDALVAMNSRTGTFNELIQATGEYLDRFAARIVVAFQQGGGGFQRFLATGEKDLALIGQGFDSLFQIIAKFIQATALTHVAEDLAMVGDAILKVVAAVLKVTPAPVLALVLGLHALSLWGGLAVTAVTKLALGVTGLLSRFDALNGFAVKTAGALNATNEQLVKMAERGPEVEAVMDALADPRRAEQVGQLAVNVSNMGMSFEEFTKSAGPGAASKLDELAEGLDKSGRETVALGMAAGATAPELEKLVTGLGEGASRGGLFAVAESLITKVPIWGWVLAGAAALGGLVYWLATAKDSTEKWIDSLNTAITKLGSFSALNTLAKDYGEVTQKIAENQAELAKVPRVAEGAESRLGDVSNAAQQLGRDYGALTQEQKLLGSQMDNETGHVADISRAYGTTFTGSLELARMAGVKLSDLMSGNAKVWADAAQQIAGLVEGYKAMGQQTGVIGSDLNALSVAESTQEKAMSSLNSAYDSWTKIVGGSPSAFITMAQGMQQFATDAKAAGASMTGLNAPSLTLQEDFQSNYNNVEQLFDAMRSSEALSGSGGFTSFVKDAVAALIPLTGNNKAAAAQVSALAQEAGGPATTSLKSLQEWAGKVKDPMLAMQKATNDAAVASSNLSQDASRLANTLESDLNGEMAKSIENVTGVQQAMEKYGEAVENDGATSKTAATDRQALLRSLTEELHSRSQAEQVLQTYTGQLTFNAGATAKAATAQKDIATELANAHVPAYRISSDMDALNGAISQYGKNSPQAHQAMGLLSQDLTASGVNGKTATKQVQDYANQVEISGGLAGKAHLPVKDYNDAIGTTPAKLQALGKQDPDKTFPKPSAGFWTNNWLVPAGNAFKQMFGQMGQLSKQGFSQLGGDAKQAFQQMGQLSAQGFTQVYNGFNKNVAEPFYRWSTSTVPASLGRDGQAFASTWVGAWQSFDRNVVQKVSNWATNTVPANLSRDSQAFASTWVSAWQAFDRDVVQKFTNWASNTVPANLARDGQSFAQTWVAAWQSFDRNLLQPFQRFLTSTVPGWLSTLGGVLSRTWSTAWSNFSRYLLQPMDHFLTSTVPGWLGTLGSHLRSTWSTAWSDFNRVLLQPMEKAFTRSLPSAISSGVKAGINEAVTGIDKVLGFINNDVLAHLPGSLKIPLVSKLAAGGVAPSRMAAGSVPGTGDEDGTHIIAMGGEYMLRKPARMALEQKYGPNFLNTLNQADTLLGSGSRGNMASQQASSHGRYAGGGGILGSIEGFFSGVGSALSSGAKDLAGLVAGGAGELTKLAGEGAKVVFDAVWSHTISPMVSALGGNNIPSDIAREGAADLKTGVDRFLTTQDSQAKSAASSSGGISMAGVTNSSAVAALKAAAAKKGWTGAEWTALNNVEMAEAGYNIHAQNPTSDAYGMAQFINGASEYAQYGGNANTAAGQAVAMVNYIAQRYGDPESAWAHEESDHWYSAGGPLRYAAGNSVVSAIEQATSSEHLREAMAIGSWLSSRWNQNWDKDGFYGAFQIPVGKGITAAEANNPVWSAKHMLPVYTSAANAVGSKAWAASPSQAAIAAASSAQNVPFAKYQGSSALSAGWKAVEQALGVSTGTAAKGSAGATTVTTGSGSSSMTPVDAWAYYSGQLPAAELAEQNAFWALNGAALPKTATRDQWAAWYADLGILQQQEYGTNEGSWGSWTKLSPILDTPGNISASDWNTYASRISTQLGWEQDKPTPPASEWHLETSVPWPKGFKNSKGQAPGHIPPSAWAAWKYQNAAWQKSIAALKSLQATETGAAKAWSQLWGPSGSITNSAPTPGITVQPVGSSGPTTVDLASLIVGGPASPVFDVTGGSLSGTGNGFAAGGSLSDVAGMFAVGGAVPMAITPAGADGLVSSLTTANNRTLSDAASSSSVGLQVQGDVNINNPRPEKPSDSITRSSNRLAFLAGRGAV